MNVKQLVARDSSTHANRAAALIRLVAVSALLMPLSVALTTMSVATIQPTKAVILHFDIFIFVFCLVTLQRIPLLRSL